MFPHKTQSRSRTSFVSKCVRRNASRMSIDASHYTTAIPLTSNLSWSSYYIILYFYNFSHLKYEYEQLQYSLIKKKQILLLPRNIKIDKQILHLPGNISIKTKMIQDQVFII